jgi:hypothetical protein
MGWETRKGGGRYYTRTVMKDGRQKRQYFGAGPLGEAAAALDKERRELEQRQRAEQEEWDALGALLDDFAVATDLVLYTALYAEGFHKHGGEWRRRQHERPTET